MSVEEYYDEKAPYYNGEYLSPFFQVYNTITWENIKQFLPDTGVILDAGGGTGEWAVRLAELGYTVVLTDISKGMLRQARLKLEEKAIKTVTLKRVDITDMSLFPDKKFDMVLTQGDPLSYCGNAEKAVSEFYRVLKPEKYCIASVDSLYYFMVKLIRKNQWDILDNLLKTRSAAFKPGFTIKYFTPQSLHELFENAGFTVVRMLGKPVFLSMLPRESIHNLLSDCHTIEKIVQLELKYCDDPSLIGCAGHLEIVGKKGT